MSTIKFEEEELAGSTLFFNGYITAPKARNGVLPPLTESILSLILSAS